jgi:hypothetical protein
MTLVAGCATPQSSPSVVKVPAEFQPGPNESLVMMVPARGAQIYQ